MGGKYTLENVIRVEDTTCDRETASHAMWHFANWQLWNKEEDRLAWKGLSALLGKEEMLQELSSLAGKKGGRKAQESRTIEEQREACERMRKKATREDFAKGGRSGPPDKHSKMGFASGLKRRLSVKLTSPTGEVFLTKSVKEAAQIADCKPCSMTSVLKKYRTNVFGWTAEYL
jgi:hypothetical protein